MKILLASNNKHKLIEFKALLEPEGIEVVGLSDMPESITVEETGNTFLENSILKARAAFTAFGLPSVADDSGLEVVALDNKPGIFSSRFAGVDATDEKNIQKLLEEMKNISIGKRQAQFVCDAVFVTGLDDETSFAEGITEGEITFEPKGDKGFGYDPVFFYPPLQKTFGEIPMDEKNKISHRFKATQAIKYKIVKFCKSGHDTQ
ncbi:MAG: RdgB/HAM1 family non-canonical purine NTP pyrophosphatase [Candidatus Aureabacteria bacterium]|nr:RdgB/HAM1 family non-canonical purine NTP pyrophosphatase [Candidatus Auribacterota bacterium]